MNVFDEVMVSTKKRKQGYFGSYWSEKLFIGWLFPGVVVPDDLDQNR